MSRAAGEALTPFERTITLTDMVAYAGATWDWYGLHYDPDFVARAKVPAPVVDGQVFGALFVELLQDNLGPQSFVRELAMTYRNLMFAGETVRVEGLVEEVQYDHVTLRLTATILASDFGAERPGSQARATVLTGRADGPDAR